MLIHTSLSNRIQYMSHQAILMITLGDSIFGKWQNVHSIQSDMLSTFTVMSLLEAPCVKTSWRALLFRAILGITGALIVCFDRWRFKQSNNSETGFGDYHCYFEQHMPCLTVHVCINSVKFVLKASVASILWGRYYSNVQTRLGALLLGRALLVGTLRNFNYYSQWN